MCKNANVSLTGEVTGKNVTGTIKVFKKINNFEKHLVTNWEWQAYSTRDYFLVVSKRYLDCILAEPEEVCQRHLKHFRNDFVVKKMYQKWF